MTMEELKALQQLHVAYNKHAPLHIPVGPWACQAKNMEVEVCSCLAPIYNYGSVGYGNLALDTDGISTADSIANMYRSNRNSFRKLLAAAEHLDAREALVELMLSDNRRWRWIERADTLSAIRIIVMSKPGVDTNATMFPLFKKYIKEPADAYTIYNMFKHPDLQAWATGVIQGGHDVRIMHKHCCDNINGVDIGLLGSAQKLSEACPAQYEVAYHEFKRWCEARIKNYGG